MKYRVIVSDKASDMLQRHIAFIANGSKKSAIDKKKEIVDAIKKLKEDANIYLFFENEFIPKTNITNSLYQKDILFFIKSKIISFM